jgi:HlyD family secretion protein
MKRMLLPALGLLLVGLYVAQTLLSAPAPKQQTRVSALQPRVIAEGRVVTYPGGEVTVGTDTGGTLEQLRVHEQDAVHKGDVIATLRADDIRAALAEARAHVGEAEADIRLYELETKRAQRLVAEDIGSRETFEKNERDLDAARARRASAIAEANRLDAVLAKSVIKAPIEGVVIARMHDRGETVAAGEPLVTIADTKHTRIEAEVDEFDAARVRNGGAATVSAEGIEAKWRGVIEEVPDNVVSRRLKPQDPAKPIDTRVLLVKVALAEPAPLKLGQRVEVEFRQ